MEYTAGARVELNVPIFPHKRGDRGVLVQWKEQFGVIMDKWPEAVLVSHCGHEITFYLSVVPDERPPQAYQQDLFPSDDMLP